MLISMLASSYNRLPCLHSILYQIHPNKMLSEIASDAGNDSMCSNSVWANTVRNMTHSCIHRVVKSINNYLFFDVINKPRQFCDQGKILNSICERKRLVSHCTADKIWYCSTDYAYIKRNDICDVSWLRSLIQYEHPFFVFAFENLDSRKCYNIVFVHDYFRPIINSFTVNQGKGAFWQQLYSFILFGVHIMALSSFLCIFRKRELILIRTMAPHFHWGGCPDWREFPKL